MCHTGGEVPRRFRGLLSGASGRAEPGSCAPKWARRPFLPPYSHAGTGSPARPGSRPRAGQVSGRGTRMPCSTTSGDRVALTIR